jgi:hypothetical protein
VAHECGHIFLHNDGVGYHFPGHVKELEAESYAHQAFRQHGMTMPDGLTEWGRAYVGSWVEKDRAAGIPIDPRAVAYASGRRSPYEPLRMIRETWECDASSVRKAMLAAKRFWSSLWREALEFASYAVRHARYASRLTFFALLAAHALPRAGDVFPKPTDDIVWAEFETALMLGLLWANVAVMWRVTTD